MSIVQSFSSNEVEALMMDMLNVLTVAHAGLEELEEPHVMPVDLMGVHHVVQVAYKMYEALIRHMGYEQNEQHRANVTLYEEYISALPP